MITYSGSCGSRPMRPSAASIAIAPSCVASYLARPPPSRAKGVRTAATITLRVTLLRLAEPAGPGAEDTTASVYITGQTARTPLTGSGPTSAQSEKPGDSGERLRAKGDKRE